MNARKQLQRRKRIHKRADTLRRKRGFMWFVDPQKVASYMSGVWDDMIASGSH